MLRMTRHTGHARWYRALFATIALSHCTRRAAPSSVSGTDASVTTVAPRAPDATSIPTALDAAPRPPRPSVDLISTLGLSLAVSSRVDNAGDLPEHLVDRNPETAWNSRSEDLVGAWIDVRVPPGATVTGLRMIVGYARTNRRGQDLFTMNHRVSRIEVLLDGRSLGEFAMDVDTRTLQTVQFSGGAGTYRVRVAAMLAGERPDWREACVSELELLGTVPDESPGDAGARAVRPTVGVGALPDERPAVPTETSVVATGPSTNVAAYCRARMRDRDRAQCRQEDPEGARSDACFCGLPSDSLEDAPSGRASLARAAGAVLGARIIPDFTDPSRGVQCVALVQTQSGWYAVGDLASCMRAPNMTGDLRRMIVRRFDAQEANGTTSLTITWDALSSDLQEGEQAGPLCGESVELRCEVAATGAPTCRRIVRVPRDCSRRWRAMLTD